MKILDGASDFEDGDALHQQHRKEVGGGSAQKPGKGHKRQSVSSALTQLVDLSSPRKAVEQSDLTFAQTGKTDKMIRLQADHPDMFGPEERRAAQNLLRQTLGLAPLPALPPAADGGTQGEAASDAVAEPAGGN